MTTNFDRRAFLTGAGGGLLGALLPSAAPAQTAHRIDVHSHIAPPAWVQRLSAAGVSTPPLVRWSPAAYVEELDRAGVARAISSITSPGLWVREETAARSLARACSCSAPTR